MLIKTSLPFKILDIKFQRQTSPPGLPSGSTPAHTQREI